MRAFQRWEGPGFLDGDVGVPGESIGKQEHPQIAAGGSGFLAVWTDMRTSYFEFQGLEQNGRDIYAALIDANGAMVGTTPIVISEDVGSQQEPEAAWNGQNWLVVWEQQVSSGTGSSGAKMVYGARVAPDGTLIDSTPVYAVPPGVETDIGVYTSSIVGSGAGGVQMVWADMSCNCPDEWGDGVMPWDVHRVRIAADAQMTPHITISCSAPAQTNPDLTPGSDGFLATRNRPRSPPALI